jgi:hypothetical protein
MDGHALERGDLRIDCTLDLGLLRRERAGKRVRGLQLVRERGQALLEHVRHASGRRGLVVEQDLLEATG